jgi:hypothetical protein
MTETARAACQSVPPESWFTGHSLGGALAALAAMRLHFEDPRLLADGVYAFGQPRVCDRLFAQAHDDAFHDRTHRLTADAFAPTTDGSWGDQDSAACTTTTSPASSTLSTDSAEPLVARRSPRRGSGGKTVGSHG